MKTVAIMKAIGYTRYASVDQANQFQSPNPQEKAVEDYCRGNNIELLHVFHDVGSGMNFERENWKNLEAWLADPQNKVQLLIVSSLDRISRDCDQAIFKMAALESQYNINVVSSSGNNALII